MAGSNDQLFPSTLQALSGLHSGEMHASSPLELRSAVRKIIECVDRLIETSEKTKDGKITFFGNITEHEKSIVRLRLGELIQQMILLFGKSFFAAAGWEAVSDVLALNANEIEILSKEFLGYSVATGAGAAVGVVPGMFLSLFIVKAFFKTEKILTKEKFIQAMQLAGIILCTDSFWAIAYRLSVGLWHANVVGKVCSGVPLFLLGLAFIAISKGVHQISTKTKIVSVEHSFNPSWSNVGLMTGVGTGEIFFGVAPYVSQRLKINTVIKLSGLAMLMDCVLSGAVTGLGSIVPYFLLFTMLFLTYVLLKPTASKVKNNNAGRDIDAESPSVTDSLIVSNHY